MNNSLRVAVIVLNLNGRRLLPECLRALKKQTYQNFKIYIADGYSTDGSLAYLKRQHPDIKIILTPAGQGTALSSNIAVNKVTEKLIVLMSNDIKLDRNCLSQLVKTVNIGPKIAICSAMLLKYRKDKKKNDWLVDNIGAEIDKFGLAYSRYADCCWQDISKNIHEVFASFGGCFLIRKDIYNKTGGFDPKFITLNDDIDLSWRLRLLGYKVIVNPLAFGFHRGSATLGKLKMKQTRYLSERNICRMLLKNYSLKNLLGILPQYLFLEFAEILFFLLMFRLDLSLVVIKALCWNIIHLGDTLKERSQIQNHRKISDKCLESFFYPGSYKIDRLLPAIFQKKLLG